MIDFLMYALSNKGLGSGSHDAAPLRVVPGVRPDDGWSLSLLKKKNITNLVVQT